jgi:hypothetical protein
MKKHSLRFFIYFISLVILMVAIIIKKNDIVHKNRAEIPSIILQWQKYGHPVKVKVMEPQTFTTKQRALARVLTPTQLIAHLPRTRTLFIVPGSVFESGENGNKIKGRVDDIQNAGEETGILALTLRADAPLNFPAGQMIPISIAARAIPQAFVLPTEAVLRNGESYVWKVVDNQVVKAAVTTAPGDEQVVLIEKGLSKGDQVIIQGQTLIGVQDRARIIQN